MSDFPIRLRKMRERNEMKRCVLSELCGLNRNSIKRYEEGTAKPTIDAAIAIADYFGVSVDFLLGRDAEKYRQNEKKYQKLTKK